MSNRRRVRRHEGPAVELMCSNAECGYGMRGRLSGRAEPCPEHGLHDGIWDCPVCGTENTINMAKYYLPNGTPRRNHLAEGEGRA